MNLTADRLYSATSTDLLKFLSEAGYKMCLAVPMQIVELLDNGAATVASGEIRRRANLSLLKDYAIGDYVVVHAGFAIEKLNREEAEKSIETYRELTAIMSPDGTYKL